VCRWWCAEGTNVELGKKSWRNRVCLSSPATIWRMPAQKVVAAAGAATMNLLRSLLAASRARSPPTARYVSSFTVRSLRSGLLVTIPEMFLSILIK